MANRILEWFFVWVRCDLCGMVFRARGPILGGRIPRDTSIEEEMIQRSLTAQRESLLVPADAVEATVRPSESKDEVHA